MDRGTNACNFLLGRVVPLKLGYVGVVNRCQEVQVIKGCSWQIQNGLSAILLCYWITILCVCMCAHVFVSVS